MVALNIFPERPSIWTAIYETIFFSFLNADANLTRKANLTRLNVLKIKRFTKHLIGTYIL